MSEPRRSLAGRALAMLGLFVGFYVLALGVALALIAAPVLEVVFADRLHFQLVLLSFVGLAILWSLVPRRREQWVDPGPRFTAGTQPELVQLIRRVADEVGQPMPAELYFIDDINAFVTTRDGFMGMGGRSVLAVGVPLMMTLDSEQLASVLAHEFGHFHGGDTRLGPLVYRTRGTMERTLRAATGWVQGIFKAYASFYLARTQGISRAQEFAADRLAARVTSAEATAGALARLPIASAAFAYYRNNEYAQVLMAGHQPPYLPGFDATLASATAATDPGLSADIALGSGTQSRFDSHPNPVDRIRALGVDPRTVAAFGRPATPATSLLRDPPEVQAALVAQHTRDIGRALKEIVPIIPASRQTVRWEDVGQQVILPNWRASVTEQLLPAVPHLAPADVPVDPDGLAELGSMIVQHAGVTATRPERESTALRLCGWHLAIEAADAGWRMDSLPGEPIRFSRQGRTLHLLHDYAQVCAGALDRDTWRERLSEAGLSSPTPHHSGTIRTVAERTLEHAAASAVRDAAAPSSAAAVAPARQQAPAALQYRGTPLLRRELVIDGHILRWRGQVVDANDVTAVGHRLVNNQWDGRFALPSGEFKFKASTGRKASEAWSALLRWSELYIEPRLVDDLLMQLRDTGRVEIDGVTFTAQGVTPRRGPMMPWEQFAGTTFTGTHVSVRRTADNIDGHAQAAAARTHVKHGGVLVPQLCQAILASRN